MQRVAARVSRRSLVERQSRHFAKFRRRDLELGNLDEMSKLAHETRTMHRMKPQPEKERWENFPTFELTEERVAELKKKAAEKPHQVPRLLHWYMEVVVPHMLQKFNFESYKFVPFINRISVHVPTLGMNNYQEFLWNATLSEMVTQQPVEMPLKKVRNSRHTEPLVTRLHTTMRWRDDSMWNFLDRLAHQSFPFDLSETFNQMFKGRWQGRSMRKMIMHIRLDTWQNMPEQEYEPMIQQSRGIWVNVEIMATGRYEAIEMLRMMGFQIKAPTIKKTEWVPKYGHYKDVRVAAE